MEMMSFYEWVEYQRGFTIKSMFITKPNAHGELGLCINMDADDYDGDPVHYVGYLPKGLTVEDIVALFGTKAEQYKNGILWKHRHDVKSALKQVVGDRFNQIHITADNLDFLSGTVDPNNFLYSHLSPAQASKASAEAAQKAQMHASKYQVKELPLKYDDEYDGANKQRYGMSKSAAKSGGLEPAVQYGIRSWSGYTQKNKQFAKR